MINSPFMLFMFLSCSMFNVVLDLMLECTVMLETFLHVASDREVTAFQQSFSRISVLKDDCWPSAMSAVMDCAVLRFIMMHINILFFNIHTHQNVLLSGGLKL